MDSLQFKHAPPALKDVLLSFPTAGIILNYIGCGNGSTVNHRSGWVSLPVLEEVLGWGGFESHLEFIRIASDNPNAYSPPAATARPTPPSAFAGLSRRTGKKPIIAAVNGLAYGGGCEAIVNCDLVFAGADHASFGFPEVKRGVFASAGALPRITRKIGKQRAMEMVLTGRVMSARKAKDWGFVNDVVEGEAGAVVAKAIGVAQAIAANSPDAVIISRQGVMMGWEGGGAEEGSRLFAENFGPRLAEGDNIKEGLKAFVEKRKPSWTDTKL